MHSMHDGKEDIMRKHSHSRAKRGLAAFMLVIMTALILPGASSVWTAGDVSAAETSLQDGTYAVPVSLLNESQDKASMADNALNHEGKLVISGGTATLYMNLVSIKSSGLEGYLMQFDVLKDVQLENGVPKKYSTQSSKTVSTYSVTDDYNKSGSSDKICAGRKYPKVVSIPVDLTQDFTWVHMYIPVMGSLGFGDQIARLKVDVSQAKAMTQAQLSSWQKLETSDGSSDPGKTDPGKTDPGKNNGGSGKNNTNGKKTGKLDKNDLADGKYTVMVHLWHATQNRESMGNATLNHQALITVKKGVYTMDISTHPVKIGSVTACLQSLWIKQSGGYTAATVKARNNAGGQPSVFSFRLPSKDQYIPAKIDPKVEVMGRDPIDARLRISWDTLKKASSSATVKENTSTTNSSVSSGLSSGSGSGLTGAGAQAAEDMPEEDMTSADGSASSLSGGAADTGDVLTTQSMMAIMLVGVSMIASLAMVIVVMVTMIRLAGRRVH